MTTPTVGDPLPDITVHLTGDRQVALSDFRGQALVLYFYPRASTPGCTTEGREFNALLDQFKAHACQILGASRDTLRAQENFKAKQEFAFDLISDPDEVLCQSMDVMKLKNMYGKQVRGIERSTFLFDADGVLHREWRKVRVKGHVDEVLQTVKQLQD